MAFVTHEVNGVVFLTSTLLSGVPHGFSTRRGGVSRPPWDSLNLGPSRGDDPDAVKENYRRFCAAVSGVYHAPTDSAAPQSEAANGVGRSEIDSRRAVLAKQVHETTVRPVTAGDAGKGLYRERDFTADALITDVPDLPLVVFSADCGILLLHDPVSGAVGAVHAGWRGCAGGIVEKAVRQMERQYGADAPSLRAAIGPCIGPCCFETDADVPDAMRKALGTDAEPYLVRRGVKWHVDLAGLNRLWLIRAGVPEENIDVCGICTACHPEDYWSHRKMGEARGVQTALIMGEAAE
ncbi:MAG: laccase domain-containing protein [Oscillibacter sp.]|nr:laccase domain-containing protein [Oscillibacter sp.]